MAKEITMNDLHEAILKVDGKVDKMETALTALVKDVAATNKILIAHQFDNIAIKNMYMREEHPDWLRGNRLMDRSGKRHKKTSPKKR